jgi:pyruvate dehydrogenase phosphatase
MCSISYFKFSLSVQYLINYSSFPGFATEHKCMSADVIRKAVQATEEGFLSLVTKEWPVKPQIAAVGSCCLVGVICAGTLYVANLGDSRAVLGRLVKATGEVLAMQLSLEHNACHEEVRQELRSSHPDDPHIVVLKHNVWRVKGLIQVDKVLYYDIKFLACHLAVDRLVN